MADFPAPPKPRTPPPVNWTNARLDFESTYTMSNFRAIAKKYRVTEEEVEMEARANGWVAVPHPKGEVQRPKPPPEEPIDALDAELPPEATEFAGELIAEIAKAKKITPEMIPGVLAFAMIRAIHSGKAPDIVKVTDLAGRHKAVGAWEKGVEAPSTVNITQVTPEDLTRQLAEVLKSADADTRRALAGLGALTDGEGGPQMGGKSKRH